MIVSFGNKATAAIWAGMRSKQVPFAMNNVARRKLRMINAATEIEDSSRKSVRVSWRKVQRLLQYQNKSPMENNLQLGEWMRVQCSNYRLPLK